VKLGDSINEFLDVYCQGGVLGDGYHLRRPLSPMTVKYYRKILGDFNSMTDVNLEEVGLNHISRFLNFSGYRKEGSKKTALAVLARFFNVQVKLERLFTNPVKEWSEREEIGGRGETKEMEYLEIPDLRKLYWGIQSPYKIVVGLQGGMGLRISEVIGNQYLGGDIPGIHLGDVSRLLKTGSLMVRGKGRKTRPTTVSTAILGKKVWKDLRLEIASYKEFREEEEKKKSGEERDNRLLPFTVHDVNVVLKATCSSLGIPVITSHGLRHSFGMGYIYLGGRTEELKVILGHNSIITTEKYGRASPKSIEEAMERLKKMEE
jgi:integrase